MTRTRIAPQPPELASPWRTDARAALQAEARNFARDTVLPLADELDRHKAEMPRSLIAAMADRGWFGITIPKEHGGMGLGVFEYCLVSEELARSWLSVGSILARGQGLGTQTLDPDRRADLMRRSAMGEWIGSISLSEPTAGSDLAGVSTRAVREGDTWILTGRKRWAGFAKGAHFIEVLARTRDPEPGESRSAGLEPFLVVKEPGTFPQGMQGRVIDKIGYHGFETFELDLDGVRVPESDRLTGLYGDQGPTPIPAASRRSSAASTSPASTRRPAPSGWPGRRWRIASSTCRSASSSATRSAISRPCASRWPTWPPRWRRGGPSGSRWRTSSTSASPPRRNRPWSSSPRPRWRCG